MSRFATVCGNKVEHMMCLYVTVISTVTAYIKTKMCCIQVGEQVDEVDTTLGCHVSLYKDVRRHNKICYIDLYPNMSFSMVFKIKAVLTHYGNPIVQT